LWTRNTSPVVRLLQSKVMFLLKIIPIYDKPLLSGQPLPITPRVVAYWRFNCLIFPVLEFQTLQARSCIKDSIDEGPRPESLEIWEVNKALHHETCRTYYMLHGNSTNHNPVGMDIQVQFWYFEGVPPGSINICYKVAVYSRTSLIQTPKGQS